MASVLLVRPGRRFRLSRFKGNYCPIKPKVLRINHFYFDGTKNKVHFVTQFPGTNPRLARHGVGAGIPRGQRTCSEKEYFVRQAAILFGLAKATTDPKISAALLDKAADLKLQVDEPGAPPNSKPLAPDNPLAGSAERSQ